MTWFVLWLACTAPAPEISSIDPREPLPGAALKVLGENFPADATVSLVQGEQVVPLDGAVVRGPVLIEGTVPPSLPAGTWTVRVASGDVTADLADALKVTAPESEVPCGGAYTSNTQLALARELVVIDRFYDDGHRETLRIPLGEVERVEYELVKLDDERLCGTIYMKKKDGRRVAFDDDTRLNLEPRAYKLGNVMKRPTVTTRKDVDEDPRPVEEN